MVKSAESVMVARPADEVFRYVADLRNEPSWHVDIASVPPDTDPVPVIGKTYALKFKPFLGKTDGTFTALEVEPGARVVYRETSPAFSRGSLTRSSQPGRTPGSRAPLRCDLAGSRCS